MNVRSHYKDYGTRIGESYSPTASEAAKMMRTAKATRREIIARFRREHNIIKPTANPGQPPTTPSTP